jgi:hypothetical protein
MERGGCGLGIADAFEVDVKWSGAARRGEWGDQDLE